MFQSARPILILKELEMYKKQIASIHTICMLLFGSVVVAQQVISFSSDRRFETDSAVSALEFSPDDKWIAVGMTTGNIELRRSDDFSVVRELTFPNSSLISTIKISNDGETLFARTVKFDAAVAPTLQDKICSWHIATGKLVGCQNKQIEDAFSQLTLPNDLEVFSNSENISASKRGNSKPIKSFKIPPVQKNINEFSRVTLDVAGLSFDSKILIHAIAANSVEQNEVFTGWIRVWDFEKGRLIKSDSIKNFTPQSIAFSHDNRTFAIGGELAGQGFVVIGRRQATSGAAPASPRSTTVASDLLSQLDEDEARSIRFDTLRIDSGYALQGWINGEAGGQALLRFDAAAGRWVLISMSGGVYDGTA